MPHFINGMVDCFGEGQRRAKGKV